MRLAALFFALLLPVVVGAQGNSDILSLAPTAWYKSYSGNTYNTSTLAVSAASDRSGNTRNLSQGTGSLQPLVTKGEDGISCLPAFDFDGTDDYLASAATLDDLIDADAYTIFIVFSPAAVDSGAHYLFTDTNSQVSIYTDGGNLILANDSGTVARVIRPTGLVVDGLYLAKASLDQGYIYLSSNGGTADSAEAGDVADLTGTVTLGGTASGGAYEGLISEAIFFDKVLSDQESDTVIEYLGYTTSDPQLAVRILP